MSFLNLNHHRLTEGQRQALAVKQWTTRVMNSVAADQHFLNLVVGAGEQQWRVNYVRAMHPLCKHTQKLEQIADSVFTFFCGQIVKHWREKGIKEAQRIAGMTVQDQARKLAFKALDYTEEISPMTPDEIIDEIEVESDSDYETRSTFYGPDGDPTNFLRQLKDQAKADVKRGKLVLPVVH